MCARSKNERYVVETAPDYATAHTKLFIYEYDCILLDIMLPDGNGLNLMRELAERGKREKRHHYIGKGFYRRQGGRTRTRRRRLSG